MEEIQLGSHVTCKVTGYHGVVTSICLYLHSETRYGVDRLVNDEIKTEWFPKDRLSLTPGTF